MKDALNFLGNSGSVQKGAPGKQASFGVVCSSVAGSMTLSSKRGSFNVSFSLSNLGLLKVEKISVVCREMVAAMKFLSCNKYS